MTPATINRKPKAISLVVGVTLLVMLTSCTHEKCSPIHEINYEPKFYTRVV